MTQDDAKFSKPEASGKAGAGRRRRTWNQASAMWIRWVHIYVSMLSCSLVLFFSATGLTLNHPTWFGGDREMVKESSGAVNVNWVAQQQFKAESENAREGVARLEIVEHLRKEAHVRGAMKDFVVEDSQCIVAFRAPGYSADAFIDRSNGKYDLVESSLGWVAVFNDLHTGRESGAVWSWLIDLSAMSLALVSATGLVLLFYLHRHRATGLATAVGGMIVIVAIYMALVPR